MNARTHWEQAVCTSEHPDLPSEQCGKLPSTFMRNMWKADQTENVFSGATDTALCVLKASASLTNKNLDTNELSKVHSFLE